MTKLKDRSSEVNWEEEGLNLGAGDAWDNFKENLDIEVTACFHLKRRRKGRKP